LLEEEIASSQNPLLAMTGENEVNQ
jgi:hypothetical protein